MSGDFNKSARRKLGQWPEDALQALAAWWADRLPEAFDGKAITPEQRDIFKTELVRQMANHDPGFSEFPDVRVTTHDQKMFGALRRAGFEKPLDVTRNVPRFWTFAYPDGQVFVPEGAAEKGKSVPLDYPGRPDTPFRSLKDIDFSDCSYYRDESRYLVVPLQKGQAYTLRQGMNEGAPAYHDGVAEEDQVLVVWEDRRGMLDKLTVADALDAKNAPDTISFSHPSPAAEYAAGAVCPRSGSVIARVEKHGDKNIAYMLSSPFRAWQSDSTFATGSGSLYKIVNTGDYVTRTERDGNLEVRRAEYRADGWQTWLQCDEKGDVDFPMKLETPAKISRPIKLKT